MRHRLDNSRRQGWLTLVVFCALSLGEAALAALPTIDLIEPYLTSQVLLHFDTEANRTYELQYTETMTNGVPGGNWTNLFVAPSVPFQNHYIIVDTRMRPLRFYRLHVFP